MEASRVLRNVRNAIACDVCGSPARIQPLYAEQDSLCWDCHGWAFPILMPELFAQLTAEAEMEMGE